MKTTPRTLTRSLVVAAGAVVAAAGAANADFVYPDFVTTTGISVVGSAVPAGNVLSLTTATERIVGAAWYTGQKVAVAGAWESTFTYRVSNIQGSGADGIAMVIQNAAPNAIGGTGGGMGYGNNVWFGQTGIPNSIALEFDTWNNSPADWPDPSASHVSLQSRGLLPNDPSHAYSLGGAEMADSPLDTYTRSVRVTYVPGLMSVYLDGAAAPMLAVPIDIASQIMLDPGGLAWIGFTSATGGATDVEGHEVLNWTYQVPTPGAAALLGLGALTAARRRRA